MIMDIKELLAQIAVGYKSALSEKYEGHPMAKLIREQSKAVLSPILSDEYLMIKGSAGIASWTFNPWIVIFNRNETDGVQDGVYVAYLFSDDLSRVYLALMHGVDKRLSEYGKAVAFQQIDAISATIRADFKYEVSSKGFNSATVILEISIDCRYIRELHILVYAVLLRLLPQVLIHF